MRTLSALAVLALATSAGTAQEPPRRSYVPPKGFVPDSATAVRIAVAVWIPIYGEQQIMSEQPFIAKLDKGVWTVTGTLPEGYLGGTAIAHISKQDGRILFVFHER
jgi:hypothetical protein